MAVDMATQNQNRDELTGVWNRKYALERLESAVGKCAQVALIYADIDRLKSFNDQMGHIAGDEKIIEIAREIENLSGENSLVFRFGGDEFGVILPETSLEKARQIAETIRAHRKPFPLMVWESKMTYDKKEIAALTLSLGVAHYPTHVSSAQNLFHAADVALLKAKRGGRLPDGTSYIGRNRVMAIGDFWDEFPEQSARFLRDELTEN